MIRLDKNDVITNFKSVEAFEAEVLRYSQALADHAKTVDVPAPTTHAVIEHIVRQNAGGYVIVEPDEVPVPVKPKLTERKVIMLAELAAYRWQLQSVSAVRWNGRAIPANATTLGVLTAFLVEPEALDAVLPFKVASGEYVDLQIDDARHIVRMIRRETQSLFDRERSVSDEIGSARSHIQLDAIDVAERMHAP